MYPNVASMFRAGFWSEECITIWPILFDGIDPLQSQACLCNVASSLTLNVFITADADSRSYISWWVLVLLALVYTSISVTYRLSTRLVNIYLVNSSCQFANCDPYPTPPRINPYSRVVKWRQLSSLLYLSAASCAPIKPHAQRLEPCRGSKHNAKGRALCTRFGNL